MKDETTFKLKGVVTVIKTSYVDNLIYNISSKGKLCK